MNDDARIARKRILIIEDEPEISLIIRRRLESFGYEVAEAYDGQEGFNQAKSSSPDLIILDLVLPSMSGIQILKELKKEPAYKHIPILIVTGLSQDMPGVKECVGKADGYFLKPFDSVELVATVTDFLKNPPKT